MATLTGNQIDQSYSGLIKTTDNAAIGATEKEITDGLGTASTLKLGTTSASFTGTLDLTGATVTGLPDVDTTYTIGSVQDGANADIKLTDQLGNQSKVTLIAGTNITLSNSGNDLTIDAAATPAGLVNGTGTDSLKQADTLTTNAANASGPQAIAIGNGANATGNQAVTIGNYSEATNVGCASIGEYASATGLYSSAWGRTAAASGDGAVAFGQQTQANQAGAVAIGRQVQSDTADTTHVRALKIVAPDGVALGGNGITFLSPDGTAGVVTLLDTDELALDGVAIGGGGAAGLVDGGGTGSQKSADAISDGANSATGYRSIAIGSGNQANASIGVAIGNYTRAGSNAVAIGDNANTSYGAKARSVSIGNTANAEVDGVAIGKSATASAAGSVALGLNVTAAIANTVSISALEVQTNSTPTAGGIIMADAGGTDRRINIDAAGALQIDSTPVGGGGGSEANEGQAITPCLAPNAYSIPWVLSGYSQAAGKNMTANTVQYIPFYAKAGEAISDFRFDLQIAQAAATMDVGLYKGYVSTATGFKTVMPEFVATIASAVDVSTTGTKNFTGLNISLPADAEGGLYWIGFISDTSMVALKVWSNWVAAERIIYNDIYRGTGVEKAAGSFALPTGQIDLSSGVESTTDLPVDFQWRYKS